MKKIKILTVTFDTEIKDFELPAFRGAIIDKVGRNNILFHNHLDDDKFLYKYPLIQYKTIGRKPAIQCIDVGVDEIHKFFEKSNWDLKISGRVLDMKIDRLDLNQFTMQVWDKTFDYTISNWIALNKQNYQAYITFESLVEKISLLEKILTANILAFAKGIEWTVDKPIVVKIINMNETRGVKIKGQSILGFNVTFCTNVFIPKFIGLGKSVSLGYGVVSQPRKKNIPNA